MKYFSTLFTYEGRLGCQEWLVEESSPNLQYLEKGENPPRAEKFIISRLEADPDDVSFIGIESFKTQADMEFYTNTIISKRTPGKGFND